MKSMFMAAVASVLVLFSGSARAAEEQDILTIAMGNKDFSTLVSLVKAADLVDTLKGKGPFTVFAPTNDAFAKLSKETLEKVGKDKELLKKILLAHVVVEKTVMAADVLKMNGQKVNGFKIDTTDGVKIGAAKVTKADVKATNGVIHIIDTVLIPE